MLALIVSTALAADRVLDLDGDTDPARVAQVAALDAPPAPITASDLSQRSAAILGGGKLSWCTGAPTGLEELGSAMADAEGAIAYMEYETAAKTLGDALASLQCLADPVDPAIAARLFYLRGVVAHRSGFEAEASRAFGIAFVFQPDLAWDDAFPPKALGLFKQAKDQASDLATVSVRLVPDGRVTVDGIAQLELALVPGTHLLQVRGQTATLEVYPGTTPTLVLPALFDGIEDISSPTSQAELTVIAGQDRVYVVQGGRVWGPNPDGYAELGRLPKARTEREPKPEPPPKAPRESSGGPRWLLPAGGVVALAGAGVGTAGLLMTRSTATEANTTTSWAEYQAAVRKSEARVRYARVGFGVAAVGAAAALAGVVLTETRGWSLVPVPGGLMLTVIR